MSTLVCRDAGPADFRRGCALGAVLSFGKQIGPPYPKIAFAWERPLGPGVAIGVDEKNRPVFVVTGHRSKTVRIEAGINASQKTYVFCQLAPVGNGRFRAEIYANLHLAGEITFESNMGEEFISRLVLCSNGRQSSEAAVTIAHVATYHGVLPANDRIALGRDIMEKFQVEDIEPTRETTEKDMTSRALQVVVDTSVYLAATQRDNPENVACLDIVELVDGEDSVGRINQHAPATFVLELFAAILRARKGGRERGAAPFMNPRITNHDITQQLASDFIQWHQLRLGLEHAPYVNAGDLSFLAVAWKVPAIFITIDQGALRYADVGISVMTPTEFHHFYHQFLADGGAARVEAEAAAVRAVLSHAGRIV